MPKNRIRNHHTRLLGCALGVAAALSFLLPAPSSAETAAPSKVLLIGLDASHNPMVQAIPAATYRNTLSAAFSSVNDSLLPHLTANDHASPTRKVWNLRTVGVGLGIAGQIGLGPIYTLTANTRLRIIFSNSLNSVYPH